MNPKLGVLALLAVALSGCLSPIEESFKHTLNYRVSVEFRDTEQDMALPSEVEEVKNITVIVPFPFLDELPMDLQNLTVPENWKAEIIETPYGKMLKLRGENVKTWKMEPMPVPVEPGKNVAVTPEIVKRAASYEFEVSVRLERDVNTLKPLDNEYVLKPKLDLKEDACGEVRTKYFRNLRCYTYTTKVFYESEPMVNASVVVWLEGRNDWFQMGWTGNEFDDFIHVYLTQEGWQSVNGRMEAGTGVYR